LRPGLAQGPDAAAPRAAPGTATGYFVPMRANGGQAGANYTSFSGNTGGNVGCGYQVCVSAGFHF
jgi:hypothetical protein